MTEGLHRVKRKFKQEIHTRSGHVIVTYTVAECAACGVKLVIAQDANDDLHDDIFGFDVRDEIVDARHHFRFARSADVPIDPEIQRVCVDPEPIRQIDRVELLDLMQPKVERFVPKNCDRRPKPEQAEPGEPEPEMTYSRLFLQEQARRRASILGDGDDNR